MDELNKLREQYAFLLAKHNHLLTRFIEVSKGEERYRKMWAENYESQVIKTLLSDRIDCLVTDAIDFWVFDGDIPGGFFLTTINGEELGSNGDLEQKIRQFNEAFAAIKDLLQREHLQDVNRFTEAIVSYAIYFVAAAIQSENKDD